jgi:hypothetical protein
MKRVITLTATTVALALSLAACGGPSAATVHAQVAARQHAAQVAAADNCRRAVTPVLAAEQTLQGRVTAGVNEDEYTNAFGSAQGVSYQQQYTLSHVAANCAVVVGTLNSALSSFNDAAATWIACQNDDTQDTCTGDSTTGTQVQADWTQADQSITKVQADLDGMAKGATPTPVVPGSSSGA